MHYAFTKKWGNLDVKVWVSLLITSLLSLGLLSYTFIAKNTCSPLSINISGREAKEQNPLNRYEIYEAITFRTGLDKTQKVSWDFGDGSEKSTGSTITHTFNKIGTYQVTVTVNNRCTETITIRIHEGKVSNVGEAPVLNPIISTDIANLGEETIFNTTLIANSYIWSVQELPELGKITTATAKYIFTKAGNFTITLELENGNTYTKLIQVVDPLANAPMGPALPEPGSTPLPPVPTEPLPMPEEKPAEELPETKPGKSFDQLPNPALREMLEQVVVGKKSAADFDNILCNGAGTKVMGNGKSTTFAALCNELREKKGVPLFKRKRKIKSLSTVRDEANGNCVSILYVDYK